MKHKKQKLDNSEKLLKKKEKEFHLLRKNVLVNVKQFESNTLQLESEVLFLYFFVYRQCALSPLRTGQFFIVSTHI